MDGNGGIAGFPGRESQASNNRRMAANFPMSSQTISKITKAGIAINIPATPRKPAQANMNDLTDGHDEETHLREPHETHAYRCRCPMQTPHGETLAGTLGSFGFHGVNRDSVRRVFDGVTNPLSGFIDFFPGFLSRALLLATREKKRAAADEQYCGDRSGHGIRSGFGWSVGFHDGNDIDFWNWLEMAHEITLAGPEGGKREEEVFR